MTQLDIEQRVRSAIRDGVDPGAPPWLHARVQAIPATTPMAHRGSSASWLPFATSRTASVAAILAIVLVLSVGLGLIAYRNAGTSPPTPSPATWSGPVRVDAGAMPVLPLTDDTEMGAGWRDGPDAALPWVDIGAIALSNEGALYWWFELAGFPPRAEDLDSDQTIIEYGVVLDTNGDRVGDYEFGINNDAPERGDFRVWVTDLAAGRTDERVEGPYGMPVEFVHPDELDRDGMVGQPSPPSMGFTFLSLGPTGPRGEVPFEEWRFYVWATVTEDGEVVAWDYGPDFGWLTLAAP